MRRFLFALLAPLALSAALPLALARPVALNGVVTSPRVETKILPSGQEGLPVWFLERLGVEVNRVGDDFTLRVGARSLIFAGGRWQNSSLPLPEKIGVSPHVSLAVLTFLGVKIAGNAPEVLDFALPAAATAPAIPSAPPVSVVPAPAPPPTPLPVPPVAPPAPLPAQLATVRTSRTLMRAMEHQRVVLELSAPGGFAPQYQLAPDSRGLTLTVPQVGGAGGVQKLESGDVLTLTPTPGALTVRLDTVTPAANTVFTLADPPRVVIDTVTNLNPAVTPPPDLENLPPGAAYKQLGKLHLLSFDPNLYAPKVVTAGVGRAGGVLDLVKTVGGVAGVNGGYFDPRSDLPVDLVALGGLMVAPSLEKRGAVGFTDAGVLFGFPKPRYALSGPWGSLTVNTVGARANPNWLTLFVGDGRTRVGGGLTTLSLNGQSVVRATTFASIPAVGEITVTFDPARFPQLPRLAGSPLTLTLNWQASGWAGVKEALAAGPLLVDGGRVTVDPVREGFDTRTNVWRPTRQVAFALYGGQPTIAYFENGTPEDFARALAAAGVERALRLDSGSSATVYVAGGFLNTVWSRAVPNAIVMVPRTPLATGSGK